jgi:hypothetical protein
MRRISLKPAPGKQSGRSYLKKANTKKGWQSGSRGKSNCSGSVSPSRHSKKKKKKERHSEAKGVDWYTPIIPESGRLRKKDHAFKHSLEYIV